MDTNASTHATTVLWTHLAPLRPYLESGDVQEVMINHHSDIWVEEKNVMRRLDMVLAPAQVDAIVALIANINDNANPNAYVLDCRLPGLRIAAARHPIAVRGTALSIRRHAAQKITLDDYSTQGAFTRIPSSSCLRTEVENPLTLDKGGDAVLQFLRAVVAARQPILITGSTSSGKTTFAGALLDQVDPADRVIFIEDTSELSQLHFNLPNAVFFEANESLGVSIRDLVRLALRFRPTRLLLGEVRGAEAFDLLNAYNTGHSGGMVTLHADCAYAGLIALETKVRMSPAATDLPLPVLRAQIARALRYVIHCANAADASPPRAPVEIIRIDGVANTGDYEFTPLYSRFL